VNRVQIVSLIIVFSLAAIVAGVFGLFGLWWGLIMAGTLSIVAALLLIDMDEPKRDRSVKR
jgi:hypothetical protein